MMLLKPLRRLAEGISAVLMFTIFATFILQVAIRYSARLGWIAETFPLLDPANFGWTLEFNLALWVWLIFFGNAFVVRDRDHVTFDILYVAVRPAWRRAFVIVGGLAICTAMIVSIGPTWDRFDILRLKRTATLSSLLGDWIRMRDIYSVYMLFLGVVSARYAWHVWQAIRNKRDLGEASSDVEGRP